MSHADLARDTYLGYRVLRAAYDEVAERCGACGRPTVRRSVPLRKKVLNDLDKLWLAQDGMKDDVRTLLRGQALRLPSGRFLVEAYGEDGYPGLAEVEAMPE